MTAKDLIKYIYDNNLLNAIILTSEEGNDYEVELSDICFEIIKNQDGKENSFLQIG